MAKLFARNLQTVGQLAPAMQTVAKIADLATYYSLMALLALGALAFTLGQLTRLQADKAAKALWHRWQRFRVRKLPLTAIAGLLPLGRDPEADPWELELEIEGVLEPEGIESAPTSVLTPPLSPVPIQVVEVAALESPQAEINSSWSLEELMNFFTFKELTRRLTELIPDQNERFMLMAQFSQSPRKPKKVELARAIAALAS